MEESTTSWSAVVLIVAVVLYSLVYVVLARSVPKKSGVSFIKRLRVHYTTTEWSVWSDWMQALFSLGSVVLYVVDSYLSSTYSVWMPIVEVVFAVFFASNYILELVLSKDRVAHIFSLLGIVDVVTTIPVFLAIVTQTYEASPTGFVRLYRVLMISRIFKPLRLLRAAQNFSPGEDAVMEQTMRLLAYFISTLFLSSGLVQILSSDGGAEQWGDVDSGSQPMPFHDALYFIVVTFSTVGYGDISPPDTTSRLVVMTLVGFFFFVVPRELNRLNQLLDLSSKYTGSLPKHLVGDHVIVGCDSSSCNLVAAFLEEFFHEDHGYNSKHLVLLVPTEPTMAWKGLVLRFSANDRVTYLKGDLRSTSDLLRVSADKASSCFILSNRHSSNVAEEERRTFIRAINIQDFNPDILLFVEALTPVMHQRLIKVSASINEQMDMPAWLREYAIGLGKEIYVVSIGSFAGHDFSALVLELFHLHGVILLGISEDRHVVLHPGSGYIITPTDLGFIVANDADVAESIVQEAMGTIAKAQSGLLSSQSATNLLSAREGSGNGPSTFGKINRGFRRGGSGGNQRWPFRPGHEQGKGCSPTEKTSKLMTRNGAEGGVIHGKLPGVDAVSKADRGTGIVVRAEADQKVQEAAWEGHIVLVTPTLLEVATLVGVLSTPHAPKARVVIVCPMHRWNRARDEAEAYKLRQFPQVQLVVGPPDRRSLLMAGAERAHQIVVKAGKSFPEQDSNEVDDETIGQLVEIMAVAGPNRRVVVELNDMSYGNQHEILVERVRHSMYSYFTSIPQEPPNRFSSDSPSSHPVSRELPMRRVNFSGTKRSPSSQKPPHNGLTRRGYSYSPKMSLNTPLSDRFDGRPGSIGVASKGHYVGGEGGSSNGGGGVEQRSKGWRSNMHWSLSKGFAAGTVVPSNLAETLLCQAYYNPQIIMIVEALLDAGCQQKSGSWAGEDSPCSETGVGDRNGDLEDTTVSTPTSFLAQIFPPKIFFQEAMLVGHRPTFEELMRFMLQGYDALCFGLVRCKKLAPKIQTGTRKLPTALGDTSGSAIGGLQGGMGEWEDSPTFVHTCPEPGQKVMPTDKVFVLVPSQEAWKQILADSPTKVILGIPTTRCPNNQNSTPPRPPLEKVREDGAHPVDSAESLGVLELKLQQGSSSPMSQQHKQSHISKGDFTGWKSQGEDWSTEERIHAISRSPSRRGDEGRSATDKGRAGTVASPVKGSHMKLDLLLREVQLVHSRLDDVVSRIGELEGQGL